MTFPTEITVPFADGQYRFWLPMPQVNELEKTISVCELEWHLRPSVALSADGSAVYAGGTVAQVRAIRDTIRLGLIGGAKGTVDGETVEVGPNRARELVDAYVFPAQPLGDAAALAWRILAAAVYGNEPGNVEETGDV
jgi:hypothetical protein